MTEGRKKWPPDETPKGVTCPRCGCAELHVVTTRRTPGQIIRYRQCRYCGRRMVTYER